MYCPGDLLVVLRPEFENHQFRRCLYFIKIILYKPQPDISLNLVTQTSFLFSPLFSIETLFRIQGTPGGLFPRPVPREGSQLPQASLWSGTHQDKPIQVHVWERVTYYKPGSRLCSEKLIDWQQPGRVSMVRHSM